MGNAMLDTALLGTKTATGFRRAMTTASLLAVPEASQEPRQVMATIRPLYAADRPTTRTPAVTIRDPPSSDMVRPAHMSRATTAALISTNVMSQLSMSILLPPIVN